MMIPRSLGFIESLPSRRLAKEPTAVEANMMGIPLCGSGCRECQHRLPLRERRRPSRHQWTSDVAISCMRRRYVLVSEAVFAAVPPGLAAYFESLRQSSAVDQDAVPSYIPVCGYVCGITFYGHGIPCAVLDVEVSVLYSTSSSEKALQMPVDMRCCNQSRATPLRARQGGIRRCCPRSTSGSTIAPQKQAAAAAANPAHSQMRDNVGSSSLLGKPSPISAADQDTVPSYIVCGQITLYGHGSSGQLRKPTPV
ncbi:uncharacterized protein LOC125945616 isoform X2 [Dermacentor silvarum]|uniref:uncharacterized protein LOC125945616 isoform X2 n=1 Tax=Dermacentor silvarum TaxID=543639 RepID=UPI00210166FB|nr:uncharacterized protein LOC125945616 isoform X2 [Dermacentor silvarum]